MKILEDRFAIIGSSAVFIFAIVFIITFNHLSSKNTSMMRLFSEENTQKIKDEKFVIEYERGIKFMGYYEDEVKNRKKYNDSLGLKNLNESRVIWENLIKNNEQRYIKLKEKGVKGIHNEK